MGLAALRDPKLVVSTISETLAAGGDLDEHIGARRLLIVLDNFEQVIEAAPHLGALLAKCPRLTMLVTSRETLRVQAEVEFAVPPLVEGDAVALFSARSGLEPNPDVGKLCMQLDSLPLALELAAARTKALSPAQILDRLSQRLDLLKGGRDADPRQRTLRATIEWSYDLLSADEQRLLARLSVFAGGFTLEAAEVVAEADVDLLQSLVEKSLVRLTAERYWLLETIRDFAAERLEESGDQETVQSRHADYVLDLVTELEAASGSDRERARFGAEQDNFRQALAWAEQAGRTDVQLELIGRSWPFWWYRGVPAEGLRWVESAVAPSGGERSARKAKVLAAGAMFAYRLNDLDTTRSYAEDSLEMARSLGDTRGTSWPLVFLGLTASELGDFARATALYEQAIAAARETSDPKLVGIAMNNLGVIATRQADYVGAVSLFEQALAISRELRTADEVALESYNLARSLHHTGDTRRAVDTALESLVLAHEIGNRITLFDSLGLLAALALTEGRADLGARLMGAAEALREQGGCEQEADEAAFLDATTSLLNRELGRDEVLTRARGRKGDAAGRGCCQRPAARGPRRGCTDSVKPCKGAPRPSASLGRGRGAQTSHRRSLLALAFAAPAARAAGDADARRHVRARRPVHAARAGRDPHRHRAAADRALRAPARALERDDPGPRARDRDAEAALLDARRWSASTATCSTGTGARAAS